MSDVVSMAHDTGTQWLDGLLKGVSSGIYCFSLTFSLIDLCL